MKYKIKLAEGETFEDYILKVSDIVALETIRDNEDRYHTIRAKAEEYLNSYTGNSEELNIFINKNLFSL